MVTDAHVPPDPPLLAGDGLGGGVQYLSPETPPNAAQGHTAEGALWLSRIGGLEETP